MLDQPVPQASWQSDRKESTGGQPAGTAATAAWHGFQWPVCIVPPTFQQKVVVQCPLPRSPPHSGSFGQPVLRGTIASALEQTCGRRSVALCPPTRAADYPGRRGSLRRRHADARWGKAARGAEAAEHRPGQVGSKSILNTFGLSVPCVSPNSNPVVAAMCRLGSAFLRERVLDDDGALPSGPYFPLSSSAAAGTSAGSSSSAATSSSASNDPRSYSEPQRKRRRREWTQPHSTTGVETRRTPLVPPQAHPPPQTRTHPRTLPRMPFVTKYKTTWSS
jgi:hypothetical protein